jgi:polyisoprenoid-binding protein YceI
MLRFKTMNIKKTLFGVLIIVILFGAFLLLNKNSVPADLERASVSIAVEDLSGNDSDNSANLEFESLKIKNPNFMITGYGPAGKFHDLTFKNIKFSDLINDREKGELVFQAEFDLNSVDTGISNLDRHLCSEDFFDCSKNPTSTFVLNRIESIDENNYKVFGNFNLRGLNRAVSFDVTKDGSVYSSSFLISISEFGISYVGVNDEVKIELSFELE